MISLGSKVRDTITGFEGIATIRITHLYGCVHIGIQPTTLKNGLPQKEQLLDEQRVEVLVANNHYELVPEFQLGNTVKDKITGLTGIITTWFTEIGSNDISYTVTPNALFDGKVLDSIHLYQHRLELVSDTLPTISEDSSATTGYVVGAYRLA